LKNRNGLRAICTTGNLIFRLGLVLLLAFAVERVIPLATGQVQPPGSLVIEGTVCDANGKPMADAEVRLEEPGKAALITRSNARGVFILSASKDASYTISAEKSGIHSRRSVVPDAYAGAREHIDLVLDQKRAAPAEPASSSSTSPMEFADQPNFTVAGVTDWTAAGGHGSDASLRTSEALTRETLTLKPKGASPSASPSSGDRANLEQDQVRLKELLVTRETADLHRQLGEVDEELGDPLGAVHEYEQAVRLDPSEHNYFDWGSELLLHRAVWQSAEVLANGTKAYPKSARMLAALGTALFASARYEEAAQRLCEASDLTPADPEPYLFMGKIEIAAPTPLPCIEERLARFAQQQPGSALANYFYAMAIWKRQPLPPNPQDMQQVEALLEKAVMIDRKYADAYLQLGLLCFSRREYDKAVAYYEQAIAANPQLGEAHYRLGVAYDRLGEADKAKQEFQLHDEIERAQADEVERQRREVKQFLVVLQGQPASPPAH
jgi:tetratricopeptide (TPR) repeat protein